jgi:hypothetical protein
MGCAATQPYGEKILADDPVTSPAGLGGQSGTDRPARRCENQFLIPPKD